MLDAAKQATRLAFVLEQLSRYHGPKKPLNSDNTFVLCPFHNEKTPSARVYHGPSTRSPGYLRCYGCGAHHKWDDWAEKAGMKPFVPPKPKDEYALELKFDDLTAPTEDPRTSGRGELRIVGDLPPGKKWRTMPTNFLIGLGAKMCRMYYKDTDFLTEKYIYFPCNVRGKLRGFIRARMRKVKDKPSYLNAPGKWSLRYGLFPYDPAIELMRKTTRNIIVLVEGPRDALRLLLYGIPAMAILGTQSWSDAKSRVLELGGVDTVVLFMDGDKPGRDAAKKLRGALGNMFNVKTMRLPVDENKYDPGNCPTWMLDKLKRKLELWK